MIFYYTTFICLTLLLIPFIYFEGHLICKNQITQKYNKWKTLRKIIKTTTTKNNCKALLISFSIIFRMLWLMFLQNINNSITKIDRKTSVLTYIFAGKSYKIIIKPKRGPSPILQISNEKLEDLTDKILPYMGPKYNWHGEKFTPKFFNSKSLTFECSNGKSIIFKNEEICNLSI